MVKHTQTGLRNLLFPLKTWIKIILNDVLKHISLLSEKDITLDRAFWRAFNEKNILDNLFKIYRTLTVMHASLSASSNINKYRSIVTTFIDSPKDDFDV